MSFPLAALDLEFARPGAAWALLFAPVLLVLVRVLARPPEEVTGTLALWRELPEARLGRAGRARFPVWAFLAALALLLGALAWAGPRVARTHTPRTWTAVVDRSRSLGLAREPGASATRLATALELALRALASALEAGDRVRWTSPGRAPLVLGPDERPPAEWLAPDGPAEPDWGTSDQAGTVWITDRVPAAERLQAGLFASGGAEVPGVVALEGGANVWWEAGVLERRARPAPLAVRVEEPGGARLPAVLARVLAAWCEASGFVLARASGEGCLFTLALAPGAATAEELAFGRDGWRAVGRAAPLAPASAEASTEGSTDWLRAAGDERTLVRVSPGRIEVALQECSAPSGDPAAFALSFARLFERASVLPAEVVPLAERLAAGEPVAELGAPPPVPLGSKAELGPTLDAGLALGAALAAVLAFLLLGRR